MNRLNNAVKQRDTAREETLMAQTQLAKFQEELESGALAPVNQNGQLFSSAHPSLNVHSNENTEDCNQ